MNKSKSNDSKGYALKGSGKVMGHDKSPKSCDGISGQKKDMGRVSKRGMDERGTSSKAFDYKY